MKIKIQWNHSMQNKGFSNQFLVNVRADNWLHRYANTELDRFLNTSVDNRSHVF